MAGENIRGSIGGGSVERSKIGLLDRLGGRVTRRQALVSSGEFVFLPRNYEPALERGRRYKAGSLNSRG